MPLPHRLTITRFFALVFHIKGKREGGCVTLAALVTLVLGNMIKGPSRNIYS
jgi:hypothetical protein